MQLKVETKGNQRMLSNGLHGQRYHSLTVFVPTIKCPHYCQLAQHLNPERHQEHMGCRQVRIESRLELRESCLERRERERELFGAKKGPSRAQGAPLPRAVYRGFVTTGVLFGLVRVGWLRRPLRRVVYGWCLVRAG